jgi:hypothetical protein
MVQSEVLSWAESSRGQTRPHGCTGRFESRRTITRAPDSTVTFDICQPADLNNGRPGISTSRTETRKPLRAGPRRCNLHRPHQRLAPTESLEKLDPARNEIPKVRRLTGKPFDLNAAQVCVQDPAVADSAILLTQTLVQYVCLTRVVGPSYWAYRVGRIGCCHRQQDHGWLRLDHRLAPRLTGRTWSVPFSSSDVRAPPTTERRR